MVMIGFRARQLTMDEAALLSFPLLAFGRPQHALYTAVRH